MDTHSLVLALRDLNPSEYTWKFCLYSVHKSRDGTDLSWNECKMDESARWVEQLQRMILEKNLMERVVTEYSPLLPKEEIGTLPETDPQISDQLSDLLLGLASAETKAPEDFVNGVVTKPVGHAFYGVRPAVVNAEGETVEPVAEVLFLRRTNPFLTAPKALFCHSESDTVAATDTPFLKFTPATDFLLLRHQCFFLSESVVKDLDLLSRANAICGRRLEQIAEAEIVGSYQQLELAALGKHVRKFLEFDKEILDHIVTMSISSRTEFLAVYGITLDAEGRMESSTPEQCELIIDLLCGRTCMDVLGRLAVGSIKPRE